MPERRTFTEIDLTKEDVENIIKEHLSKTFKEGVSTKIEFKRGPDPDYEPSNDIRDSGFGPQIVFTGAKITIQHKNEN